MIKITRYNQGTTQLFCQVIVDDLLEFVSGGLLTAVTNTPENSLGSSYDTHTLKLKHSLSKPASKNRIHPSLCNILLLWRSVQWSGGIEHASWTLLSHWTGGFI